MNRTTHALHHTVTTGDLRVLQYYFENASPDPNIKDKDGVTPLALACYNNQLDIAKYLISKEATFSGDSSKVPTSSAWKPIQEAILFHKGAHALPADVTARVVLCGFKEVGKNTLRRSLCHPETFIGKVKALFSSRSPSHEEDRTIGFETEFIELRGRKISLWDLAGHMEYYNA